MSHDLSHLDPNRFLALRYRYEKIKVPDPTQTAINEIFYPSRLHIHPLARVQLENLVAYWQGHAKPGRVLAALRSLHYVQSLRNWKPKGPTQ